MFSADPLDHLHCFRLLSGSHHSAAVFDDPGFLLCDLCQSISKKRHMIHTDRYQHCQQRILNNICGVQISAHSHFQQNEITILFFKEQKCHRSLYFKCSGMGITILCHSSNNIRHLCNISSKVLSADPASRNFHPASVRIQGRRNISSNAISRT